MAIRDISIFILVANAILLVSTETEAETDPENYRLPNFYAVHDYNVTLHLGPKLFTRNGVQFSGQVEIRFRFKNATNFVALHSDHIIKLNKITFENAELPTSSYSVNNVTDILTIYIGNQVTTHNRYHLVISYTGKVTNESLFGLYKSMYIDGNGEVKYILMTQLGPTHARSVFPCFDEPEFKAFFNFKITFPTGLNVLFNTKIMKMMSNDVERITTAHFHQTPKMTPGLLALVVSDLTCTSADVNITTLQVCSRDESALQRGLALDVTPKLLKSLNRFTNYSYSRILEKLDIVAVLDLPLAASANLGLQIHREDELLYDKDESSNRYKEEVALIIAHELAHQWFGILLTYKWYSDIFMEEGLARYFEYYIVNEVLPDHEVEKRFVMNHLHPILVEDSAGEEFPLHSKNTTTVMEILSTYNSISYDKGGSIMRMVRYFMSLENFRAGIQNFIKNNQYSNVDSEDLWTELNKTIVESISKMPTDLNTVMRNWVREAGYPLVTVSLNGNNLTISQSRFSYFGLDNETKWYIPVSYTGSSHILKFQSTTPDFWLTPDSDFHAHFTSDNWLILNNQQIGYYRVNYDSILWTRIKAALRRENFDGIIDINRAQIIDDLFNFARAEMLPYSSVLDTIRFLKNDTSYYPWKAAMDGFDLILRKVGEHSDLGKAVGKDILGLIDNFYNSLSISNIREDDHFYTMQQQLVVKWACRLGHKNCVKEVVRLFKSYIESGKRPIVELRYIIYCNGLRYSEYDSDWYFMWEKFLKAEQPSEQSVIRRSLACSRNTTLLKMYLQKTITKDSGIRSQDAHLVFNAVASNTAGVDIAFDFLIENQEHIVEHYQALDSAETILMEIADRLTSEEKIAAFINVINNGSLNEEFEEHAYKALFAAEATGIWLHLYSDDLAAYYKINESDLLYLLYLLLLIPTAAIFAFIYYSYRRGEQIIWNNHLNALIQMQGRNNQQAANNIPMQER